MAAVAARDIPSFDSASWSSPTPKHPSFWELFSERKKRPNFIARLILGESSERSESSRRSDSCFDCMPSREVVIQGAGVGLGLFNATVAFATGNPISGALCLAEAGIHYLGVENAQMSNHCERLEKTNAKLERQSETQQALITRLETLKAAQEGHVRELQRQVGELQNLIQNGGEMLRTQTAEFHRVKTDTAIVQAKLEATQKALTATEKSLATTAQQLQSAGQSLVNKVNDSVDQASTRMHIALGRIESATGIGAGAGAGAGAGIPRVGIGASARVGVDNGFGLGLLPPPQRPAPRLITIRA